MPGLSSYDITLQELESFDPGAQSGGIERRFCCALCGQEKPMDAGHRCLCVNTKTGAWVCQRCGARGKLKGFRSAGVPAFGRARAKRAFDPPDLRLTRPKEVDQEKVGRHSLELRQLKPINNTPAHSYLESRGIAFEVAVAARARYGPHWYGRPAVVFPLRDYDCGLLATSARYIDGRDNPKTRSGPAGLKGQCIFRTDAYALEADPLIICEAPIDALSMAACGYPAVALCGLSWPEWLPSVCGLRVVLLAFDNDAPGTGADRCNEAVGGLAAQIRSYGGRPFRLRPALTHRTKDWNDVLRVCGPQALQDWLAAQIAHVLRNRTDSPGNCIQSAETAYEPGRHSSLQAETELVSPTRDRGFSEPTESETMKKCRDGQRELAARIVAHLADGPRPVRISSGVTATDIHTYAIAEARDIFGTCPMAQSAARERLEHLGISAVP